MNRIIDAVERVGMSGVEVFLASWLALQQQGGGYDARLVWRTCLFGSIVAMGKCILTFAYVPHPSPYPALDALKRIVWTAAYAFVGAWVALQSIDQAWNARYVLNVCGTAALAAGVKAILALNLGNKTSAALLPASVDPNP